MIFAGLFVIIRFGYKLYANLDLWIDDWLILATTVVAIPCAVLNVAGLAKYGMGRDMWTLPLEDISTVLKFFFITAVLYFVATTLVKMSIISFYLRIFPQRTTQLFLWATFGFTGVWGIMFVFIAIFQCRPISYFWTSFWSDKDGLEGGTCLDANAIALSHAVINIVLDFWIMAIPLWKLRKLQLHWKKKVGVALMFSVGIV